jgi:hypothetical protein
MSSAQATSSLAADAPRYGVNSADAYYALNAGGTGSPTVTQLLAGANITLNPSGGQGVVTVSASQGNNVISLNGANGTVQLTSSDDTVEITTNTSTDVIDLKIPSARITKYIPTGGADVPFPTGAPVTVLSISDVQVGKIYNYNLLVSYFNGLDGGGISINPAVTTPQVYFRWSFQGAQPPGGTLAVAPVISASATQLSNLLYTSGAPQGSLVQDNYSGFFQVVSLPVTLKLEVDTTLVSGTPPFLAANSIKVAGNASQVNLAIMGDSF